METLWYGPLGWLFDRYIVATHMIGLQSLMKATFLKFSILICLTAIRNASAFGFSDVFVALIEDDLSQCDLFSAGRLLLRIFHTLHIMKKFR